MQSALTFATTAGLFCCLTIAQADHDTPWRRHTIDDSSRGADGVKLGDLNSDNLPDIVTGWEEGGITRVYFHPDAEPSTERWPAVTVGKTTSVEDAVFADLDADGRTDVVTCCEGNARTIFVHWAPGDEASTRDASEWETQPIGDSRKRMMWMYAQPMDVDGRGGIELLAGGKGPKAAVGWFKPPNKPRRLDHWRWHPISQAGWIMSLVPVDMDGDRDRDVLLSDRKGDRRGVRWLENPGTGDERRGPWENHVIGGRDHEVMFLDVADWDGDAD